MACWLLGPHDTLPRVLMLNLCTLLHAAGSLTSFEADKLNDIDFYLKELTLFLKDIMQADFRQEEKDMSRTFRDFMSYLWSALDYTYDLMYYHFAKDGNRPNESYKNEQRTNFIYVAQGVKTSYSAAQDQTKKFKKDARKLLSDNKLEGTQFWSDIGDTLLMVQPTLPVDRAGNPTGNGRIISTEIQESFALLHLFRNYTTHSNLIKCKPEPLIVEINKTTGNYQYVRQEINPSAKHYFLKKTYWIELPLSGMRQFTQERDRLLVPFLEQLFTSVKCIINRLLFAALLHPTQRRISCEILGTIMPHGIKPFPQVVVPREKFAIMLETDHEKEEELAHKLKGDFKRQIEMLQLVFNEKRTPKEYILCIKNQNEIEPLIRLSRKYKPSENDSAKATVETIKQLIHYGLIVFK